ncbi:ABC transporter permease [Brachyspira pilosicoli]|uniref:ABC transporter permease n=1 Tax=Brachyspira pilosicoli TaxID=52584 RepID=UPI0030059259
MKKRYIITWVLVLMEIIFFSLLSNNFLSFNNFKSILQNTTELSIIAIGMTMVMITGGIDLSVGASLGVVGIITGWLLQASLPNFLIIVIVIVISSLIGLVNGVLITYGKIPDIIATIGTNYILRASIFGMLGGKWLTGIPDVFGGFTSGSVLFIPNVLIFMIILYLIFHIFMTYMPMGRRIYMLGNSVETMNIFGMNTNITKLFTYSLLGSFVGIASLFYIARLGSVEITVGMDLPIQVIAAVVIGGTSVLGGSGSLIGTFGGVLFMGILRNGINIMGVPSLWERVIIGIFIIISVLIDIIINKLKK